MSFPENPHVGQIHEAYLGIRWLYTGDTWVNIDLDKTPMVNRPSAFKTTVSPIDGEVITHMDDYKAHMKKHNVVPASEFSGHDFKKQREDRSDRLIDKAVTEGLKRSGYAQ